MKDPQGTRFDAQTLGSVASTFEAVLGAERIAQALQERANATPKAPALELLEGFRQLDDWLRHLGEPREPPNVQLMMRFAIAAMIVSRCAEMKDSSTWQARLRAHAFLSDQEPFYDTLFEGELAMYWADYVALQRHGASFGPPTGNPDVWLGLSTHRGRVAIPAECKRVAPRGEKDQAHDAFSSLLEAQVGSLSAEHYPFKLVVWLHCDMSARDVPDVMRLVEDLIPVARHHGRWVTAFDREGYTQVSLCSLGTDGEFHQNTISVTDIEAKGHLAASLEIKHGEAHRVKYIVAVRSDVQSDRLGSLRKHFLKAARDQLPRAANGMPGVVALRVRPPRQLGDLLEADQLIRTAMTLPNTEHAAMAVLFWNEDERQEEAIEHEGRPATEKMIAYHLRPYFIPNPRCRLQMDLDSRRQFFGEAPAGVLRDPFDGSFKPVDAETLEVLRNGGELPDILRSAIKDLGKLDQNEGTTTRYMKLDQPVGSFTEEVFLGFFYAGNRQFRSFVDPNRHLRTIEVSDGAPRGVCTIDLRAWSENTRLGIVTKWTADSFWVGLWSPDEAELLGAWAVPVSQPEIE